MMTVVGQQLTLNDLTPLRVTCHTSDVIIKSRDFENEINPCPGLCSLNPDSR